MEAKCIGCNEVLSHREVTDPDLQPEPGNVSVCLNCGAVMVFCDDLSLRSATMEEIGYFMNNNPKFRASLEAMFSVPISKRH